MARTAPTLESLLDQIGIPTAKQFLEFYVNTLDSEGVGLSKVEKDIHSISGKDTYQFFCTSARAEALSALAEVDQRSVIDDFATALDILTKLKPKESSEVIALLKSRVPDQDQDTPGFALYCKDLSVLTSQVRHSTQTPVPLSRMLPVLSECTETEIHAMANFVYNETGVYSFSENCTLLASAFKRKGVTKDEVLAFTSKGRRNLGMLMIYIAQHQDYLRELDPEYELLNKAYGQNPHITEAMLNLSAIPHLDREEYETYLKVLPYLDESAAESLRKVKLTFTRRLSPERQRRSLEPIGNAIIGDEVFSYYAKLLDAFPKDREHLTTEQFVAIHLPILFRGRRRLYSPENLKKTSDKLLIDILGFEAEPLKYVLYPYYTDWMLLFAGEYALPVSFFLAAENLPSEESAKKYIDVLKDLRSHRFGDDHYAKRIGYIDRLVKQLPPFSPEVATLVYTLGKKLYEDKSLETLLLGSSEQTLGLAYKVGALQGNVGALSETTSSRNLIALLEQFWSATSQFYDLFKSACDESILIHEYQQWINEGMRVTSIDEFKRHFDVKSPAVKALYAKYHSPATYEQQADVTRIVMKSVCGKDLPVAKKNLANLLQEIPFGGGKVVQLPSEVSIFPTTRENAHFYSLLGALYAGMHRYGTYTINADSFAAATKSQTASTSVSEYLGTFPHYTLAESLFIAAEELRVFSHLLKESPGLQQDLTNYAKVRTKNRKNFTFDHPAEGIIADAFTLAIHSPGEKTTPELENMVTKLRALSSGPTIVDTLRALPSLYKLLERTYVKTTGSAIEPAGPKPRSDPRVLEEILSAQLRGQKDVLVYETVREGPYYHYPEYDPNSVDSKTTRVFEQIVPARKNDAIQKLLGHQQDKVARIQQHLEQLVPQDPYIVRQRMQGNLDRRAHLKYHRDLRQGKIPNPRIFYRKVIEKRDVATIFALDMNRTLNEAGKGLPPRQALQELFATFVEGSRSLGDPLGVYGFSGTGPNNVMVYVFKDLAEPLTEEVYSRLAFVAGQNYNRNGAAYRHFTSKFAEHSAKKKLFIELCASYVPFDVGYQGEKALADSARAIQEMRLQDINPVCISLSDTDSVKANLRYVFGEGSYITTTPTRTGRDLIEMYKVLAG